jgi:hypothetical protein
MANKMESMESIKLEIEAAKNAGFSSEEIQNSYADEINAAQSSGFSEDQINKTYGFAKPDNKIIKDYINKITKDYLSEEIVSPEDEMLYQSKLERGKPVKEAVKDIKETVVGKEFDGSYIAEQILGNNLYNFSKRAIKGEGTPEALRMPQPKDYTWTEEFLTTAGTLAIESPLYALSATPGFLAGGPIGAGFTGAMIPTTTRSTLLKVLENQDEGKPSDIMKILIEETLVEGAKEGTKFAVSMALPMLKIPGVGPLAQNYFSRTAAQIVGYQGTGNLIFDEEIPNMREFSLTSALFAIFNLRLPKSKGIKKSKQIFIDYGKKPTDVALDSSKSRTLREDLLSDNMKIIRDYEVGKVIDPKNKIIEQKIIKLKKENRKIYEQEREKNNKDNKVGSKIYKETVLEVRKNNPESTVADINRAVAEKLSTRTNKKLEPIISQIKKLENQLDKIEGVKAYEIKDGKEIEIPKEEIQVTREIFDDPIANKAAQNISFEGIKIPLTVEQVKKTIKESAKTTKRKFIITAIDRKYPVLEALQEAKINTKTGLEKLNEYELLRLQEGMQGRSAHFIEFGTLDFNTLAETGPSLMSIAKPFVKEKSETKLLSTYITNRQAVSLAKRGKESGVDIPNAEIFLKKYANIKVKDPDTGKMISYEQAAKKIDTYQQSVLKYAYDGGLITKESYNAYKEINQNYVPMARELPRPGESGFIKGSGNPFKRLKGSKAIIIDPLETIVKNTDYIVRMTELNKTKNDTMNIILEAKKKDPESFDWIEKKKGDLKPITVQRKELEKFFDKETLDKLSDKGVQELAIFRQEVVYPDANSIFFRDIKTGKYEIYSVGKDLATAFRVMDNPSMGFVAKWLTAPTRTLRAGAIVTPSFALPNFFKDTMNATFLSKVGWIPIVDSIRGIFHVVYKDPKKATEAYKRYLKGGGGFSTLRSVDRTVFDKDVHTILNKGIMRNEYSGLLGPFKYLTDASELSTRVMMNEKVYQKAKKQGLSERDALQRAGFESKNLLDYTRQGTVARTINKGVPFFTARINGAVVAYEAGRDRPKKFFAMIGLAVVLPTVGNYISNLDENGELDKDYQELPDYIKNNKYYFKVNGKGRFFPKGFEVGTFFSNLTERVLDYIRTNERQEFMSYVKDFAKEHAKGYAPIPTFLRPHIENLSDYSIFREAPILPSDAPKDMLNSYYSTEYTNPTIKALAEKLTTIVGADNYFANPIYLENIYDSYTGGVGKMAKDSVNAIAIKGGIIDDPIRPEDPLTKIPGIRVFQAKDVYGYSKSIQQYYNKTKKYKTIMNTVDYLEKIGNVDGYLKEASKVNFDIKAVIDIEKDMKDVSKMIKTIYNAKMKEDGTLFTPEEKRDLIDDLYKTRIGLAQKALQIIKDVEQDKK